MLIRVELAADEKGVGREPDALTEPARCLIARVKSVWVRNTNILCAATSGPSVVSGLRLTGAVSSLAPCHGKSRLLLNFRGARPVVMLISHWKAPPLVSSRTDPGRPSRDARLLPGRPDILDADVVIPSLWATRSWPLSGTPIRMCPGISASRASAWRAPKVRSRHSRSSSISGHYS